MHPVYQEGDVIVVWVNGKDYDTHIINGVQRFHQNKLNRYLVDSKTVNLNQLCSAWQLGHCDSTEYIEFIMGLGYSVDGLCGVLYSHEETENWHVINSLWDD